MQSRPGTGVNVDRAQGIHGNGGRSYTAAQGRTLSERLKTHVGKANPTTVEQLSDATGVGGRAVRQFLSDYDGVWFLLGGGDDGYFICEFADEGSGFTHRIQSQVRTMQDRLSRRNGFAEGLPSMQFGLF